MCGSRWWDFCGKEKSLMNLNRRKINGHFKLPSTTLYMYNQSVIEHAKGEKSKE
jgi:hypothetical protein